jgi:hypothetical protein
VVSGLGIAVTPAPAICTIGNCIAHDRNVRGVKFMSGR